MIVYFNGKYIDENKVSLSIKDRGFLLGDGVFETILYKNKKLIFLSLKLTFNSPFSFECFDKQQSPLKFSGDKLPIQNTLY